MKRDQSSRTAVMVCMARAAAHERSGETHFTDSIAFEMLAETERQLVNRLRAGEPPRSLVERFRHAHLAREAPMMVARTLEIDNAVRRAQTPQVVILGAGLDGRAWRMAELQGSVVFEVDHPASQRDKRSRSERLKPTAREVRKADSRTRRDATRPATRKSADQHQALEEGPRRLASGVAPRRRSHSSQHHDPRETSPAGLSPPPATTGRTEASSGRPARTWAARGRTRAAQLPRRRPAPRPPRSHLLGSQRARYDARTDMALVHAITASQDPAGSPRDHRPVPVTRALGRRCITVSRRSPARDAMTAAARPSPAPRPRPQRPRQCLGIPHRARRCHEVPRSPAASSTMAWLPRPPARAPRRHDLPTVAVLRRRRCRAPSTSASSRRTCSVCRQEDDRCELVDATINLVTIIVERQDRRVGAVAQDRCVPERPLDGIPPPGDGSIDNPLLVLHRG